MSGNNLEVKITADSSSLVAASAVAKAQVQSLATAMSTAAKQTLVDPTAIAKVQELASALVPAKTHLSELAEQMKNTRTASGGLGGAIEEARAGLSRVFQVTGIAAAAEGVMKLGEAIEQFGSRATEMRSLSEVLGVNTSQLQAMQVAAEETGTSMEVLSHAEEHLTVMLSEARNGSGKAIEQLHALGISTQEIAAPTFQLNQLLAVLKSRLADVSSAESTRKALLQELGARTALAIEAIKEYDGSQQGVESAMKRVNGMSQDQIDRLAQMKASWGEFTSILSNTAQKALLAVDEALHRTEATVMQSPIGDALNRYKAAVMSTHPELDATASGPGRSASSTGEQDAAEATARAKEAANNEALRSEMESIREGVAAFGEGTAQRLAMLRQYAADARKYYGSSNVEEVRKANSEVLAAQREFQDTQGREQIAQAHEQVAEISAETNKGAIQRLVEEAGIWQQLLDGDRLNATQRLEVQRSLATSVASIARASATEQAEILRSDTNSDIAVSHMQIAAAKQTADAQVAATQDAVARKYSALQSLTEQEYALDLQRLQNELATLQPQTAAYEQVYNQIKELKAKEVLDLAALDRQAAEDSKRVAKEQASDWKGAIGEIENAESGMVSDLLTKRKSLSQSLISIGADLVTKEIANDLKAFTTRIALQDSEKALQQGGLVYHELISVLKLGDTTKQVAGENAAVIAGNSARQTATAASLAAGQAVQGAAGASTVMSDAAQAFAGTFASVAQIPYVGWALAPGAAAAAFSTVASMAGLASLDVGTNYVPGDMLAQIHEGEAVIPKRYNPAANGGGGGSIGGLGTTHNYYGSMSITHGDFKSLMSSRAAQSQLVKSLASAYRRGARIR